MDLIKSRHNILFDMYGGKLNTLKLFNRHAYIYHLIGKAIKHFIDLKMAKVVEVEVGMGYDYIGPCGNLQFYEEKLIEGFGAHLVTEDLIRGRSLEIMRFDWGRFKELLNISKSDELTVYHNVISSEIELAERHPEEIREMIFNLFGSKNYIEFVWNCIKTTRNKKGDKYSIVLKFKNSITIYEIDLALVGRFRNASTLITKNDITNIVNIRLYQLI